MRRHIRNGLTIANNTEEIIHEIDKHKITTMPKTPNQTHKHFYTYDFSCNEDYVTCTYHDYKQYLTILYKV